MENPPRGGDYKNAANFSFQKVRASPIKPAMNRKTARPPALPTRAAGQTLHRAARAPRACALIALIVALLPTARVAGQTPDVSFRNEVSNAIQKGLAWLETQQGTNGHWSNPEHPALTALALSAFRGEPTGRYAKPSPKLEAGYDFILRSAKPDGGIYVRDLPSYNTSLAIMALLAHPAPESQEDVVRKARSYLIGLQQDRGVQGRLDTPLDGGIGYGGIQRDPDINNSWTAFQALYHSRHLIADRKGGAGKDLDWKAALHFLESCQNSPSRNTQSWVSSDPADRDGFVYLPGRSMAGGTTNATTGKVALRSYGSISYAGLLSYIYADLKRDDPRVAGVVTWLQTHYTLDENPGMGAQGLYYYLHLMAKGLSAAGVNSFELKSGKTVAWRQDLAMRLLALQQRDGSWMNENPRWWEKDPVLSTSYALLALETVWRGL